MIMPIIPDYHDSFALVILQGYRRWKDVPMEKRIIPEWKEQLQEEAGSKELEIESGEDILGKQ